DDGGRGDEHRPEWPHPGAPRKLRAHPVVPSGSEGLKRSVISDPTGLFGVRKLASALTQRTLSPNRWGNDDPVPSCFPAPRTPTMAAPWLWSIRPLQRSQHWYFAQRNACFRFDPEHTVSHGLGQSGGAPPHSKRGWPLAR